MRRCWSRPRRPGRRWASRSGRCRSARGHRADLDSGIADLKQCATGGLLPDACHAAAFLREFAGDTPWAHLDIAGVASRAAAEPLGPQGPSGFGARLLDALVSHYFEDPDRD